MFGGTLTYMYIYQTQSMYHRTHLQLHFKPHKFILTCLLSSSIMVSNNSHQYMLTIYTCINIWPAQTLLYAKSHCEIHSSV